MFKFEAKKCWIVEDEKKVTAEQEKRTLKHTIFILPLLNVPFLRNNNNNN